MKKIILACALLFIGYNSMANEESPINEEKVCSSWTTVDNGCGGTFYLCNDHYSGPGELILDVIYFSNIQCPQR